MTWNNLNASQQSALVFASKHASIIINELVEVYQSRKSIATVDLSALVYDKIKTTDEDIKVENVVVSIRIALEHGFIVGVEGRKKAGLVKVGDIKWNNAFEFGEMKVSGKHYKRNKSVEEVVAIPVIEELSVNAVDVEPVVVKSPKNEVLGAFYNEVLGVPYADSVPPFRNQSLGDFYDRSVLPAEEVCVEPGVTVDADSLINEEEVKPSVYSIGLHLELPKVEEKKKRGGFPVGMVRTGGGAHGPRKDPLERAKANPRSKKLAIYAACFDCQGGRSDSGVVKRIRECAITRCPLLSHRPYQKTKADTIEELTEVDVLDESIDTDLASE
jgi:hypothetical protein